ncbi:hypothetical protein GWK47_009745 [Chionoecetes opilio]|uniref:Uncharacterized protein n=1 Tax=Chionoecetes opilio TaxID=41210 RepID=A0A8J4Y549_CHIOP|nr:hypothetical protein GWK47_009745 [Chionoecetes opilio]
MLTRQTATASLSHPFLPTQHDQDCTTAVGSPPPCSGAIQRGPTSETKETFHGKSRSRGKMKGLVTPFGGLIKFDLCFPRVPKGFQSYVFLNSPSLGNALLEWVYLLKRQAGAVSFCWVPAMWVFPVMRRMPFQKLQLEDRLHIFRPATDLRRQSIDSSHPSRGEENKGAKKTTTIPQNVEGEHCRPLPEMGTALDDFRIGHTLKYTGFPLGGEGGNPPLLDILGPLNCAALAGECPSLGDLLNNSFPGVPGADGAYRSFFGIGGRGFSPGA